MQNNHFRLASDRVTETPWTIVYIQFPSLCHGHTLCLTVVASPLVKAGTVPVTGFLTLLHPPEPISSQPCNANEQSTVKHLCALESKPGEVSSTTLSVKRRIVHEGTLRLAQMLRRVNDCRLHNREPRVRSGIAGGQGVLDRGYGRHGRRNRPCANVLVEGADGQGRTSTCDVPSE